MRLVTLPQVHGVVVSDLWRVRLQSQLRRPTTVILKKFSQQYRHVLHAVEQRRVAMEGNSRKSKPTNDNDEVATRCLIATERNVPRRCGVEIQPSAHTSAFVSAGPTRTNCPTSNSTKESCCCSGSDNDCCTSALLDDFAVEDRAVLPSSTEMLPR